MSNFKNLPNRILKKVLEIEKKIVTFPIEDKIKRFKQKQQDLDENRELIITDKLGNRYYQYYSHHGIPARRIVHLNMKSFNRWEDDPIMLGWLNRKENYAPSQEELEKKYIEQEEFQRRGIEWDKKEEKLLNEYRIRHNKVIEEERKETKALGEGETFQPGIWERTQPIVVNDKELEKVEGLSTIQGKYIMDFKEEDEKWMKLMDEKRLAPLNELLKKVDFSNYTMEKMNERFEQESNENRRRIEDKRKQLTNIGKKMLEKKEQYKTYTEFRTRFKDVFDQNDKV